MYHALHRICLSELVHLIILGVYEMDGIDATIFTLFSDSQKSKYNNIYLVK